MYPELRVHVMGLTQFELFAYLSQFFFLKMPNEMLQRESEKHFLKLPVQASPGPE